MILNPQIPNYEGHCANLATIISSWLESSGNGITQSYEIVPAIENDESWKEGDVRPEIQTAKLRIDEEGVKHEQRNLDYALGKYLHVSGAGLTPSSRPPKGFKDTFGLENPEDLSTV